MKKPERERHVLRCGRTGMLKISVFNSQTLGTCTSCHHAPGSASPWALILPAGRSDMVAAAGKRTGGRGGGAWQSVVVEGAFRVLRPSLPKMKEYLHSLCFLHLSKKKKIRDRTSEERLWRAGAPWLWQNGSWQSARDVAGSFHLVGRFRAVVPWHPGCRQPCEEKCCEAVSSLGREGIGRERER